MGEDLLVSTENSQSAFGMLVKCLQEPPTQEIVKTVVQNRGAQVTK